MLALLFAIVVTIAALSHAAPTSLEHTLHEKRQSPSTDWVKGTRIESSAILPMRIGLVQSNLEKGHDFLMEVSQPDSPIYGQYWTPEEIHDMFAPAGEAVQAVREWLTTFGIDDSRVVHSDNKGWLAFDATVEEAESFLLTEYHEHEHPEMVYFGQSHSLTFPLCFSFRVANT